MIKFVYFYNMLFVFLISMLMSFVMFYCDQGLVMEWMMISFNSVNIEILIYLDWVSVMFISIVLLISSMILLYSMIYMYNDKFIYRYYWLVMMFVLSMILMIISPNLISILFGWDGLGLVSYCLVIYYQNYVSYNSGMLTVLMNRVGDVLILMIIGMMYIYGSWNMFMLKKVSLLIFLLILASMTKSAQIPFSSWLPSAMAAPTPVSALVHSSTLVTAGVYLMIRFSKYLMINNMNKFLLFMSIMTMFMAGLMAMFELDLKKIIALSTLSQLGLMMMILSVGLPMLAYYHLLTHAIFKSLLFMGAGVIIHLMNNNQDIRYMGGLMKFIPFTMMSFHISIFALCGFPFMSGFYSKDLIMEMIYIMEFNMFLYIMALVSLMFTVVYSFRLSAYLFFGEKKMLNLNLIHEYKLINYSMMILMIFSVIIGSLLNLMFFDEMVYLKIELKMLTYMLISMGLIVMFMMMLMNYMKLYYFSYFCSSMWFLNYIHSFLVKPMAMMSFFLYMNDKNWMEFYSKKFFINMMVEYKNYVMNYLYKIFMFLYIFIILMITMMIMW